MLSEKRAGRTEDEARRRALDALKEKCWRERWRDNIELPVVAEKVTEVAGMFEVEIWTN